MTAMPEYGKLQIFFGKMTLEYRTVGTMRLCGIFTYLLQSPIITKYYRELSTSSRNLILEI